jgi:hypothetical protein
MKIKIGILFNELNVDKEILFVRNYLENTLRAFNTDSFFWQKISDIEESVDYLLVVKNDFVIINADLFVQNLINLCDNSTYETEEFVFTKKNNSVETSKKLELYYSSTYLAYDRFKREYDGHGSKFFLKYWAYNSEVIPYQIPPRTDCLLVIGAGLLPLAAISHLENPATIIIIDHNKNCIDFQKFLINNFDYIKNSNSYHNLVDNYTIENRQDYCNIKNNNNLEVILKNLDKIRKRLNDSNILYFYNDITEPNLEILDIIRKSNNPYVYFSNVFCYTPTLFEKSNKEVFETFLNMLLGSNLNLKWQGESYNRCWSTNYVKNSDEKYYWPINIQVPYTEFLKEIEVLESKNLFVKHREADQYKGIYFNHGWESFCICGISYNKTHGSEKYGYTEETAPYRFTPQAMENCPKLVEWFRTNNFKDRYHRVRVMKLKPGGLIGIHYDNENHNAVATNIAINNPDNCEMHFINRKFQYLGKVPWKAGDVYKIRIGLYHYVINMSKEDRYHLIVHGTGGIL